MQERSPASIDPFERFKSAQRDAWSSFAPQETFTTMPAARLVSFAGVAAGARVLDVACGTGVVAVTAARRGARVAGLDLTPALIEHARRNASTAAVEIEFIEGDVENLPFADASFDVVLSQFGHMFAPRPEVAIAQMLRVLRPGGRIAFSTWPPESFVGRHFEMIARYLPPPGGGPPPAPPSAWGDPAVVADRLAAGAEKIEFDRGTMIVPALSLEHVRLWHEKTIGPLAKAVEFLRNDPERLARLRAEFESSAAPIFGDNHLRAHFLMTRAVKRP